MNEPKKENLGQIRPTPLRHALHPTSPPVNSTLIGKWMGYKDAGRTVMLGYSHLRTEHSQKEAATMKFL